MRASTPKWGLREAKGQSVSLHVWPLFPWKPDQEATERQPAAPRTPHVWALSECREAVPPQRGKSISLREEVGPPSLGSSPSADGPRTPALPHKDPRWFIYKLGGTKDVAGSCRDSLPMHRAARTAPRRSTGPSPPRAPPAVPAGPLGYTCAWGSGGWHFPKKVTAGYSPQFPSYHGHGHNTWTGSGVSTPP